MKCYNCGAEVPDSARFCGICGAPLYDLFTNADPRRLTSARSADMTPLSIDKAARTGRFMGSSGDIYETSLEDCTCMDFSYSGGVRACKHMLRLAMELGVYPNAGMVSDIQRTYAKYYLGILRNFIAAADLMEVLNLYRLLVMLLKSTGAACEDDALAFAGVPKLLDSGLFELGKKEKIKAKKEHKKDLGLLQKAVTTRVGETVMANLDYGPLIDVLKELPLR